MLDLQNIVRNSIPDDRAFFQSEEDYQSIPPEHKDQIKTLTPEAGKWLRELVNNTGLVDGRYTNTPLTPSSYKQVDIFSYPCTDVEATLKKWLYNRKIPFSQEVFLIDYYEDEDFCLSWKMLIKYSDAIFYGSDKVVFDKSLNWCLVQYAVDTLHFGRKAP